MEVPETPEAKAARLGLTVDELNLLDSYLADPQVEAYHRTAKAYKKAEKSWKAAGENPAQKPVKPDNPLPRIGAFAEPSDGLTDIERQYLDIQKKMKMGKEKAFEYGPDTISPIFGARDQFEEQQFREQMKVFREGLGQGRELYKQVGFEPQKTPLFVFDKDQDAPGRPNSGEARRKLTQLPADMRQAIASEFQVVGDAEIKLIADKFRETADADLVQNLLRRQERVLFATDPSNDHIAKSNTEQLTEDQQIVTALMRYAPEQIGPKWEAVGVPPPIALGINREVGALDTSIGDMSAVDAAPAKGEQATSQLWKTHMISLGKRGIIDLNYIEDRVLRHMSTRLDESTKAMYEAGDDIAKKDQYVRREVSNGTAHLLEMYEQSRAKGIQDWQRLDEQLKAGKDVAKIQSQKQTLEKRDPGVKRYALWRADHRDYRELSQRIKLFPDHRAQLLTRAQSYDGLYTEVQKDGRVSRVLDEAKMRTHIKDKRPDLAKLDGGEALQKLRQEANEAPLRLKLFDALHGREGSSVVDMREKIYERHAKHPGLMDFNKSMLKSEKRRVQTARQNVDRRIDFVRRDYVGDTKNREVYKLRMQEFDQVMSKMKTDPGWKLPEIAAHELAKTKRDKTNPRVEEPIPSPLKQKKSGIERAKEPGVVEQASDRHEPKAAAKHAKTPNGVGHSAKTTSPVMNSFNTGYSLQFTQEQMLTSIFTMMMQALAQSMSFQGYGPQMPMMAPQYGMQPFGYQMQTAPQFNPQMFLQQMAQAYGGDMRQRYFQPTQQFTPQYGFPVSPMGYQMQMMPVMAQPTVSPLQNLIKETNASLENLRSAISDRQKKLDGMDRRISAIEKRVQSQEMRDGLLTGSKKLDAYIKEKDAAKPLVAKSRERLLNHSPSETLVRESSKRDLSEHSKQAKTHSLGKTLDDLQMEESRRKQREQRVTATTKSPRGFNEW